MKRLRSSTAPASVLAVVCLGLGATAARAQAVGFSYASPGFSFNVGTGGFPGYYGYPPVVARPPVVVAPPPVVVPPPVYVRPPVFVPPPYYGGYYYGGYRPYPRYYRR
jgi:hypothetical protein